MNNEIKEILYFKENADYKKLSCDEILILRDYITNLQQENEKLKQPKIFIDTQDMEERYGEELYKDYLERENDRLKLELSGYREAILRDDKLLGLQQRIEKAVEYIENTPLYETTYDYNMEEELEIQNVSDETASNKLLNILRGNDK